MFQGYKNIPDVVVKQNARQKNVLAGRHPEFIILNVTEARHARIDSINDALRSGRKFSRETDGPGGKRSHTTNLITRRQWSGQ